MAKSMTSAVVKEIHHLKDQTVQLVQRVVHYEDLPTWMQNDPYIRRGYRKQLSSFRKCYQSLFYLHNESVNIWSHLLVGLFFVALLLAADYSVFYECPHISSSDTLAVQSYLAGATGCLFLSVSIDFLQTTVLGVSGAVPNIPSRPFSIVPAAIPRKSPVGILN